ncbi:sulfotransferase family protein [Sulfuriroseicoccus oceanibius]|uniref:Sulfotransferase n=1 Tax=Sulfuriroseicoccus oceanibius TaxID=2707525 RepID=A0A6B3L6D3_9BACT|nr:sulfotransferase [Sulfuriroseicoccus oceanibius]QQL45396.1 sulfotransferase [Sulfuriroseicoccus oceanibius]
MKLKHRWSVTHNFLNGLTAKMWWRLLLENRFAVSPAYWHRAAMVSGLSVMNSLAARKERRLFGEAVEATEITQPPVFIIGHWRSGTTHLHNLMAQDDDGFAFPNTYQVVNPETFLVTEEVNTKRFARLLPEKRLMDNMELSFQSPQEDEFAPCLTTLLSPYLGICFPRNFEHYERYLTFDGVAEHEIAHWQESMRRFVKKLTLKYQRPILLKTPAHTARIRLLLETFPGARFVHIHRNPYDVFQSTLHYYDTAVWYSYLQKPDRSQVRDIIINRYRALYEAYDAQVGMIPEGRFLEVAYADLERDPIGVMQGIYESLGLDGFETAEPKMRRYLDTLKGYKKNRYTGLDEADRARVAAAWGRNLERWGYAE